MSALIEVQNATKIFGEGLINRSTPVVALVIKLTILLYKLFLLDF